MTLRWRLIGLYAVIVAAVLAAAAVALVCSVRASLLEAFDRQLELHARAVASEVDFEDGRWSIEATAPLLDDYRAGSRRWFLVADTQGKVMLRSPVAAAFAVPLPTGPGGRTLTYGGEQYRERSVERPPEEPKPGAPALLRVACGATLAEVDAALGSLVTQLWTVGPLALLVSLLGGCWLVARALRPIDRIARTAEQITAENLDQRIAVAGNDELARLGRTLNATFARLQEAFAREKRFTADASHELRTPLAVIAGNVELAQGRERPPAELRELVADIGAASARMRATVEGLLILARADAGALLLARERVALGPLCADSVQAHRPLAASREVQLACEVQDDVAVHGDADRLRELLANLVGNAIRYNRRGGRVTVRVRRQGGDAVLEVDDTGIGIRAEDRERIFERFFRADPARVRTRDEPEGTGLGLAIARCIAAAHRGAIAVASEVGAGSRFTVTLPATAAAA